MTTLSIGDKVLAYSEFGDEELLGTIREMYTNENGEECFRIKLDNGVLVSRKVLDVYPIKHKIKNEKDFQPQKSISVEQIYSELLDTYKRKNHDYGNSFEELYNEVGMPYAYGHVKEKIMRVKQLMDSEAMVAESMEDSLLDCANYCIMWVSELRKLNK